MAILSVIIVSYNEVDLLSDCLKSIEKFNDIGEELEVIVSDNSSSKNVVNMISYKYPLVKFIHNEKNGGFGYGNNRGVEIATGKYLLFLNPDTLLIEPIFRYAISKFEGNEKLVSFGFKQKSKDNKHHYSFYLLDEVSFLDNIRQKIYLKKEKYIDGKMFIAGSELFIRRDIFSEIGGFDENLFMFYEESDLFRRIWNLKKDYKTAYFGTKSIIHLIGGTREEDVYAGFNSIRMNLDSMKYYAKKYHLNFESMIRKFLFTVYLRMIKAYMIGNEKQVEEFKKIIKYIKDI